MPRTPLSPRVPSKVGQRLAGMSGRGLRRGSPRSRSPGTRRKTSTRRDRRARSCSVASRVSVVSRIWHGGRKRREATSRRAGQVRDKTEAKWGRHDSKNTSKAQEAKRCKSRSRSRNSERATLNGTFEAKLTALTQAESQALAEQPDSETLEKSQSPGNLEKSQSEATPPNPEAPKLGMPLWSFRRHLLWKPAAEVDAKSPEQLVDEYKAYLSEHEKDSMERYWLAHHSDALLRDRYYEPNLQRAVDWKLSRVLKASETFLKNLPSGSFSHLNLSLTQPVKEERDGFDFVELEISEATRRTLKPAEPWKYCLALEEVPPSVSFWQLLEEIEEIGEKLPGFEDAALVPIQGSLLRTGYLSFESEAQRDEAIKVLRQDGLKFGECTLHPKAAAAMSPQLLLAVPACVEEDAKKAVELVHALEAARGAPTAQTEKVLGAISAASGSSEHLLDLCIIYLRQVHFCCFYTGAWCSNAWGLLRFGAGCIRQTEESTLQWQEHHASCLAALLQTAKSVQHRTWAPPSLDEEPLKSRWIEHCKNAIKLEKESRYRCTICSKLFKSEDFAIKHISKMHGEAGEKLVKESLEQRMKEAFFADASVGPEAQAIVAHL